MRVLTPDQWNELVGEMISNTGFDVECFSERSWCFIVKLLDAVKLQRVSVEQTYQKLIESQDSVIHLQHQLLEKKTELISENSDAVQSTVSSTVEKGFKSYSDVMKKR